jgi:hypothetical protein
MNNLNKAVDSLRDRLTSTIELQAQYSNTLKRQNDIVEKLTSALSSSVTTLQKVNSDIQKVTENISRLEIPDIKNAKSAVEDMRKIQQTLESNMQRSLAQLTEAQDKMSQ